MDIIPHQYIDTSAFYFIYIQRYKLVKVLLVTRLCSFFPNASKIKPVHNIYVYIFTNKQTMSASHFCNTTCRNYTYHFAIT